MDITDVDGTVDMAEEMEGRKEKKSETWQL